MLEKEDVRLDRINRALTALSQVNQAILRIRDDADQLLNEACAIIHQGLGYDLVWIGECHHDGEIQPKASQGSLMDLAASTGGTEGGTGLETWIAAPPSLHKTACQTVKERRPVIVEQKGRQGRAMQETAWVIATVPVFVHEEVAAVISAASHNLDIFDTEEVGLLQDLAGDIGFALETMAVEARTQRAEEALHMSEERFRRLAEHSLVGIVLIQNNLYRYVNPAFAQMFGYESPTDIIDKLGPLDLAAPESRDLVAENVHKRIQGRTRAIRYQYRGLRQNGTIFDVEEYGARTIHAQRLGIVATVLDVTAREASRRRLEALSHAGLALSTTQTPQQALDKAVALVGNIVPCDIASIVLIEDQRLRLAAQAAAARHQSLTGTVNALVSAGLPVEQIAPFQHMVGTGEPVINADAMVVPDAAAGVDQELEPESARAYAGAPLIVRGETIGFINAEAAQPGCFSEQDAQHLRLFADHVGATLQHLRLISSLEEERNRLRTLNELSHTLSETLQLQEVANRALRQIGQALEAQSSALYLWDRTSESLTALAAEGIPASTLTAVSVKLNASPEELAGWIDRHQEVHLVSDAAHSPYWRYVKEIDPDVVSILDVPLTTPGEFLGVLSFMSSEAGQFDEADADLVAALSVPVALALQNARFYERAARQAEIMAEALRRQEELDRMKDELIQNISHELRTPLALVMGYAEMLNSGQLGPIPSEQTRAIQVITRRSNMLRSLVEDIALLWNLDRQERVKEPINLNDLVTMTVVEFENQVRNNDLTILGETPEEEIVIQGVQLQLRRVLDNLIGNAIKFTQPGGTITVSLRREQDEAVLSIIDNGIGVPKEKLQRIFERFYQVDGSPTRRYGGTGLGLALVKAIVEAQDGTIRATSPINDDPERPGTRITIRLPRLHPEETTP
jgi:PAS domain S-box-containing protein